MKKNVLQLAILLFCINGYSQPIMSIIDTLDYGCIMVGSDPNREFYFYNIGDEPLLIYTVHSTSGAVVPTYPADPVEPGDSAIFKIRYNTNVIGLFSKIVSISTNEDTIRTINVIGEVKEIINSFDEKENRITTNYYPLSGDLEIQFIDNQNSTPIQVEIFNINNQLMYSGETILPTQLNIKDFSNGLYVIQVFGKRPREVLLRKKILKLY